jgi:hypothetical protein
MNHKIFEQPYVNVMKIIMVILPIDRDRHLAIKKYE